MNTKNRIIFALVIFCLAASVASSALLTATKAQSAVAAVPPVSREIFANVVKYDSCLLALLSPPESKERVADVRLAGQDIVTDVVKYDSDLINVTSNWPTNFTVENTSDKEISGFEIIIVTPDEKGGTAETMWWGTDPNYAKQTSLLKRNNTASLPIRPQAVKKFQDIRAPFLYVQVSQLFVDNDPKFKYSYGALLRQDENNWRVYHVIVDSKGKGKAHHNHAMPHTTHSVKPPFARRAAIENS